MRQEGGGGLLEFSIFAQYSTTSIDLGVGEEHLFACHEVAKWYHDIRRSNNYTAFRLRAYARYGAPCSGMTA